MVNVPGPKPPSSGHRLCCTAARRTGRSLPVQMGREFARLVRNLFSKQVVMAMQSDGLFNCLSLFFANDMSYITEAKLALVIGY
jgi:hypothetical protein